MRKHRHNWLDVFSGFRVALDARKIVLGTLGVDITIIVLLGMLMLGTQMGICPDPREATVRVIQHPFGELLALATDARPTLTGACAAITGGLAVRSLAFLLGGAVLMLFIWSFFGGAIARIAAVDVARDERPPIGDATSFAARKFGSFFWSPLVPCIFILLLLLCNVALGAIGRAIPGAGPIIVGLFFILATLSAVFALLLFLGVVFGSFFMWPTIAMEGTDAFDAISRAFNYLFARPWKTLFCVAAAKVYGWIVCGFVAAFSGLALVIAERSVEAGMGKAFEPIRSFLEGGGTTAELGWSVLIAVTLIRVVEILVLTLVLGFIVSFCISVMTIIYAILRQDVDGTDMSEVYLPEAEEEDATETPAAQPAAPAAAAPSEPQKPI